TGLPGVSIVANGGEGYALNSLLGPAVRGGGGQGSRVAAFRRGLPRVAGHRGVEVRRAPGSRIPVGHPRGVSAGGRRPARGGRSEALTAPAPPRIGLRRSTAIYNRYGLSCQAEFAAKDGV